MSELPRVGIVWRGVAGMPSEDNGRLTPLFNALSAHRLAPERVLFSEEAAADIRVQLRALAAALVWVDPIDDGRDRSVLDPILREAADAGVLVSGHPDVIARIGTKEILVATRELPFGSDCYTYDGIAQFRAEFPPRLAAERVRVVKRHRGNAGIGVWKIEQTSDASGMEAIVEVQDAHPRGTNTETRRLGDVIDELAPAFGGGGCLIDQPFQPRIADGLVRAYLVTDRIAGFALQQPDDAQRASGRVFGLPSGKTMLPAGEPRFASLREGIEKEWLPALVKRADLKPDTLPLLWDADFIFGPRDSSGADTYVLCEINASCVTPFPPAVPDAIAAALRARLRR